MEEAFASHARNVLDSTEVRMNSALLGRSSVQERMPTSFGRTATLAAAFVAVLLAAAAIIDHRNTSALHNDVHSVVHSQDILKTVKKILSIHLDAENGERGFLLTGDEAYLKPYADSPQLIEDAFREAERLTQGDSTHQDRLRRLRIASKERIGIIDETVRLRRSGGKNDAVVASGRGKAAMGRMRALIAEMIEAETALLAASEQKAEESFRWASTVSWVANGLGVLGLAAFVALLLRHLRAAADATQSLFQQRELLRTTLGSIADAVVATDAEGRVTSINEVASALTGWGSEEALGQPLETVYQIVNERTRETAESPARRCLREQRAVRGTNHVVLLSKGGGERPIDENAAPIRTTEGVVVGAVLVFRDATERTRAEDELRQMAADLSEADRRKDEFLATLAHELRNPLAPIRNSLQILKLARNDARAVNEARSIMERQLAQMARLVDDLLDMSRIARNKFELRKERIDLQKVIATAVETSKPVIDAAKHTLKVTPPEDAILLEADPMRLSQILSNLLTNAAKYTPPGGRIEVAAHREGSDACICVRDNGEGINPAKLPYIFDMFMQVDESLERSQGGLGIGLTLVRRLTELHGGSVSAKSEGIGKGSEFIVRLPIPVRPPNTTSSDDPNDQSAPATGRCKVLVVDDNRDAAQSLAQVLGLMGHQAKVAFDGLAAVEMVKSFQPHIVLLDIGLPKLNGYEACGRIRMLNLEEQPILVAITGWSQPKDRQRSKEAGFDHYFTKPVDAGQLLALFKESQCAAR
jgi:PAS domain S-box-containing protein